MNPNRMTWPAVFLLLGFSLLSCETQIDDDLSMSDMDLYKLIILPENPDTEDPILIIENTCGLEPEPILSYAGKQITYKRYFNSLMGAPCLPTLDTTVIGPLEAGSYQLVHWVIDRNHMLTDSIYSVDTLALVVR